MSQWEVTPDVTVSLWGDGKGKTPFSFCSNIIWLVELKNNTFNNGEVLYFTVDWPLSHTILYFLIDCSPHPSPHPRPGSYSNTPASSSCTSCLPGEFQSQPGNTECHMCPPGTFQGSTSGSRCHFCTAGWWSGHMYTISSWSFILVSTFLFQTSSLHWSKH